MGHWTPTKKDVAPIIYQLSKRKNKTLKEAIHNQKLDSGHRCEVLRSRLTVTNLQEYVELWLAAHRVQLTPGQDDSVTWKLSLNGVYSSASAYQAQFIGSVPFDLTPIIWKPWVPAKCKFFSWLAIRNRLWTTDRLETRG